MCSNWQTVRLLYNHHYHQSPLSSPLRHLFDLPHINSSQLPSMCLPRRNEAAMITKKYSRARVILFVSFC